MYGDRRLVKKKEIRTRGDEYLVQMLDEYVRQSGKQKHVLIRQWIEEGLKRDLDEFLDQKNNTAQA